MNAQAQKAMQAVESLAANSEFQQKRAYVLALVLEHMIQSAGDRKEQAKMRRRLEELENGYRAVVREADLDAVIPVDLSPGLLERYGVE